MTKPTETHLPKFRLEFRSVNRAEERTTGSRGSGPRIRTAKVRPRIRTAKVRP